MNQNVLIFYPGENSYIGIWQPQSDNWHTYPVLAQSDRTENRLYQTLNQALNDRHLLLKDIAAIGVMPGPASYTQLRSFVATANSLAWAKRIPLFSINPGDPLPDVISHRILAATINQPIEPVYPSNIP